MRVCIFAISALLFSSIAFGQGRLESGSVKLHYYFTLYSQADGKLAPSFQKVNSFIQKASARRFLSDKALVHFLFVKAHAEFLKKFDKDATFGQMIDEGRYNCLSGTGLFALLLDHFRLEYDVLQTNHHIFIIVKTTQGPVLLESTDREKGFVDNPAQVAKLVNRYRNQQATEVKKQYISYEYSKNPLDTVSLTGMLGLFHFNHAVKAYNDKRFDASLAHLHHAFLLHRSIQLEEFCDLFITTARYGKEIDPRMRDNYLEKLQALRNRKTKAASNTVTLMVPLVR